MGTLENKELALEIKVGEKSTYKDLILSCLDNPPANGFTRQEYKERARIDDILENAENGSFNFEDADAIVLKKVVGEMKWGVRHKDILAFMEDIEVVGTKKKKEEKEEKEAVKKD